MGKTSGNYRPSFLRNLGVLAIILVTPPVAIVLWYTDTHLQGSLKELFLFFGEKGFFGGLYEMWAPVFWGSKTAWSILGICAAVQILLMKVLPGKKVNGPTRQKDYTPVYRNNGFAAFLMSLFLFWLLDFQLKLFRPAMIYDHFGEIIGALCWSLPALAGGFIPYFYVFYLTLLLIHRAKRDDVRCRLKYGKYWEEYTRQVPYKILPGVF